MSKSSLSQLLSIEELPGELGVVEQASSSLFKEIFYDNLVVNEDLRGTNIQYTLNLVTNKPLSVAIPGTGISLLLNPGITSDDASSFPPWLAFLTCVLNSTDSGVLRKRKKRAKEGEK